MEIGFIVAIVAGVFVGYKIRKDRQAKKDNSKK